MKYLGSKNRHSAELLKIILRDRAGEAYVEPFCGGCNMLDKVDGRRIGGDIDADLMCLWKAVSNGWMPPKNITEEEYVSMKISNPCDMTPLKGYAAFALSFGGKKFGGWSRGLDAKGNPRMYDEESYRNAAKQFPKLVGVDFYCCQYDQLQIPDGSVIYCDPPYAGVTGYGTSFDSEKFYEWCRKKAIDNRVFVSEYSAPDDFVCVWEKRVPVSIASNRTSSPVKLEKLYQVS